MRVADFDYELPPDRIDNPDSFDWLAGGSGALIAALLGAYLIVARISAPLRQLARAARMVGSGETPPPQAENSRPVSKAKSGRKLRGAMGSRLSR